MRIWVKNSDGKPDAVLTFSLLAFLVVLVKFLIAGVVLDLNGVNYSFGTIDASVIAALLTPTLGAYVGRRYTDAKYGQVLAVDEPEQDPASREG